MLTKEDNELLTRVGPGTPMGALMREYWMPVVRSALLVADGKPERVRLLGENFVAFRATLRELTSDTPGRVERAQMILSDRTVEPLAELDRKAAYGASIRTLDSGE